jgi:hypothetical protein
MRRLATISTLLALSFGPFVSNLEAGGFGRLRARCYTPRSYCSAPYYCVPQMRPCPTPTVPRTVLNQIAQLEQQVDDLQLRVQQLEAQLQAAPPPAQ